MLSLELHQQKLFLRDVKWSMSIAAGILTLLVLVSLYLTWFATNAQISISMTLTYAGRERSLTQKILAESLLVVYAPAQASKKTLQADELDWTQRHDAMWRGDNSLHVLSVSSYPSILPEMNKVEAVYLRLHIAIDGVLSSTDPATLHADAMVITADTGPFYSAMENYNTFLRNLTTQYQDAILLYGVCSTMAILLVLVFSIFVLFKPAFRRLDTNVLAIADVNNALSKQKREMEIMLEEIRRADHETRVPIAKIETGVYAVQSGSGGFYEVRKQDGIYHCPCSIYEHNHYCAHVKLAQNAEQEEARLLNRSQPLTSKNGQIQH